MIAILFLARPINAQQQDTTKADVQEDLERALEDFDPSNPELENEQFTQYLQDLAVNPVNINSADINELLRVPGLNFKTAQAILSYRTINKTFQSVDELIKVKGIGPVTLEKISPYVTEGFEKRPKRVRFGSYRNITAGGKLEVFSRYQQNLEVRKGYQQPATEGGYLGSPIKYYQRFRYRSDHLSANITQEKDPGEPFEGTAGFDYLSWHVALKDNGFLKDLVIGDYGLSFGQGLVLWNGGAFGKGREVTGAVNRNGRGVSAYSSAQEANFFRGIAATVGGKLQFTGFYSYRKRTASVIAGDTIRFPQTSGLHRTENERSRYHNTRQELYGGNIRGELPFGYIGATAYKTVFSKFIDAGNAIHDRFDFSGISSLAAGIDFQLIVASILIFGEAARSENGGYGFITGVESPLGEDTDITMAYRNYSRDFQSILGDGFGELSGLPRNEEGIYLGLKHRLNQVFTLSGYFDQYKFPFPRFGTTRPTQGYDWLGLLEIKVNRNLQFYMQARSETKEDEFDSVDQFGRSQRKLGDAKRSTFRAQVEYWINKKVRIRTRGEFVQSRQAGGVMETGYLMYQDLRMVASSKWKIDSRITVFETESFNTRVYQFENDLLYVMSNEMLFGQGQRLYVLVNYEPFRFMEVWAKFGITIFENQLTIGSGLDEIQGNRRSDVGVQVRFRL